MSAPPIAPGEPITDRRQLVAYLAEGSRPRTDWRIGTEHEKFVFRPDDLRPRAYDGPAGIAALLDGLRRFGWQPVEENGRVIALSQPGRGSISLEPAGQFELSGAPLETLHEARAELEEHLEQAAAICRELGLAMAGFGFNPKWSRDDMPWMPKGRYRIMRDYMPKRGNLGLDMMQRTCTVQVNLDFDGEADMVRKFRVSLALQPIATALFANSPFTEGRPNGFQSFRSHIWTDTDPDRSGDLPFVFEDGFGFERYVDYMLDVPMYFVYRDGQYINASGQSFRDFLAGRLPALPGVLPLITDWADHVTTAFPEVRLKRYLEMRGADSGDRDHLQALPALWTGLLYDDGALDAAWDLMKDWTTAERAHLRTSVPRHGLGTEFRGRPLSEVAERVLEIAAAGLVARNRRDAAGRDEAHYLDVLREAAPDGRNPALAMLERYHGTWGGSVDPAFRDYAY